MSILGVRAARFVRYAVVSRRSVGVAACLTVSAMDPRTRRAVTLLVLGGLVAAVILAGVLR